MFDVSSISSPSPDFSVGLGVPYANPPSGVTPDPIRAGVSRLKRIRNRREKLLYGLGVLHEMLYLAECPEDFLTIANLLAEVRLELLDLEAPR